MDRHSTEGKSNMRRLQDFRFWLIMACMALFVAAAMTQPSSAETKAQRDGQHDFDFELGSWHIHLKRRLHPLTGSDNWVEFDGTSITRKVWDGRAQLEE